MKHRFARIEEFTQSLDSNTPTDRSFILLDPGGKYKYLFNDTPDSIRLVGSLITGKGPKRTFGDYVLRLCAYVPQALPLFPLVSKTTISLPAGYDFDVAIVSNRTRIVQLDSETIYTLPTDEPEAVRKEIEVRRNLSNAITTPELYDLDPEYPYFSERFVQGIHPNSPIDGWETMLAALEQLAVLYRDREAAVPTADVLAEAEARLADRGLAETEPYASALDSLADLSLPETVYRAPIHGDLHTRNVVVADGTVYLVDWENYGVDYVFCDFFKPFVVSYYDTRDPAFFRELVADEGRGGEIFEAYIERFGPDVCSEPRHYAGLPVLYLLVELARTDRGGLRDAYRELLGAVLR